MFKLTAVNAAVGIGQSSITVGCAVLKQTFIAVAVSKFMIALTSKLSIGELAGILAAFGEEINPETIDTVTLNALS
jgi:hypothetical protein